MKSGCASREERASRTVKLPILGQERSTDIPIRRSKTSRWRAAALTMLTVLMAAHIVQWQLTGSTVSPIEPSEAMYTLQNGAINAGFIFFTLAIVATLIFGRYVCGWGCHIVALQDLCAWMMKKVGITPRPFRSRLLVFVPLITALYMFVWPTVVRFFAKPPDEPLFPQFTNHLVTSDFWATFPTVAVAIPFLFICGFMTVYFLGSKGFCTYACPYGGFFAIADKFAPGKIRVTDACNQCGLCTATCMSNVQVHAEVKQYGMVIDPGCMKHMDCISVCPNDALYFGFGKPAVGTRKTLTRSYSLTWPEELIGAGVFALSFWAVWDVYQLVPMLMALGIASITTFLVLRAMRLLRTSEFAFLRYNLRSAGIIQPAGWTFLAFAFLWIGLNAHSGWIRFHERAGTIAYENVRIPDELALARTDASQWLSAADRENIQTSIYHLTTAFDRGLFVNSFAMPKLAWVKYLSGDSEAAVDLLARSARDQDGRQRALSLYYRGAILNRMGRYDEALESLDEAIRDRPDLVTAHEEKGESLWQLGRKEEAVAAWGLITKEGAGLPLALNMLSGAARSLGRTDMAAEYEQQADRSTPPDPFFHYMVGIRLENIGMGALAEKHYRRAALLDPKFGARRDLDLLDRYGKRPQYQR